MATLNTARVPRGVDEGKVRRRLLDEPVMGVAGGFAPFVGKVFRLGVMGPLATEDDVRLYFEGV